MAKNNTIWIVLIGILVVLALGMFIQKDYQLFSTMSGATMTRSMPSSVQPSSSFNVVYTVSGGGDKWGASIVDSVSGGCKFPAGTTLKSVMLSDEGTTKTIKVTAATGGTCTFSGDYKFGTETIKDFPDKTITISGSAPSNGEWEDGNGEVNGEVPSFDLNMVLFKVGDFEITLLILIGGLIGFIILFKLIGK